MACTYVKMYVQVWDAKECVVIKRSMATGYAGLDNPVFYKVRPLLFFFIFSFSFSSCGARPVYSGVYVVCSVCLGLVFVIVRIHISYFEVSTYEQCASRPRVFFLFLLFAAYSVFFSPEGPRRWALDNISYFEVYNTSTRPLYSFYRTYTCSVELYILVPCRIPGGGEEPLW